MAEHYIFIFNRVYRTAINENNKRTIYWAHSNDGIDWKAIRKPLIRPSTACKTIPGTTTKPNYANNVSGPFLMVVDNRCFVLFHGSAGNISVAEVGQNFDMEVHWGTYLNYKDVKIMDNGDGSMSAVSRVASPFFIQDDATCSLKQDTAWEQIQLTQKHQCHH